MQALVSTVVLSSLVSLTAAQSPLETTFVGGLVISNNPIPAAATQLFDVDVTNPSGIVLTQIDANFAANSNPTGQFDVWITAVGGTHVGNQQTASVWTLASAQTPAVVGGRNAIVLNQPMALAPGLYGVALHSVGFNPIYTNPASQTPPLPTTYFNADLTIDMTAARSRPSDPLDPFGGTAVGFSPRQANIALHYVVGAAAVNFSADVSRGVSPLAVQFQGIGASANPGGVLGWAWDFDNDGTPDSFVQNPQHTFACGRHTVSLTMIDALGTYTETKTDYIVTDEIQPDYSVAAVAPGTLQFTDTSTPTPGAWAWDFDNDGVVDSTLQNPLYTSTAALCSELDVVLSVSRACGPVATLQRKTALGKSIATRFDGGTLTSTTATGGVSYFDLQVVNPLGISVCALHAHNQAAAGNALIFNIYLADTTYVGKTGSRDGWALVSTATAIAAGGGLQTFVTLPQELYLPAGSYGVALEHVGHSPRYNNTGGTLTVSNADVVLTAGATQAEPVFSTGAVYTPRIANVGLYYTDCAFTAAAGYGWFGSGCASTLGTISTNTSTQPPRLGQTFTATISDLPQGVAILSLGFSRSASLFGQLPLDLTAFGAPGCLARVSPDANSILIGTPGGSAGFNLQIPATAGLLCTQFYTQALLLDAANPLGAVISDAAAVIVGQ
jgi:hypothetical protein